MKFGEKRNSGVCGCWSWQRWKRRDADDQERDYQEARADQGGGEQEVLHHRPGRADHQGAEELGGDGGPVLRPLQLRRGRHQARGSESDRHDQDGEAQRAHWTFCGWRPFQQGGSHRHEPK